MTSAIQRLLEELSWEGNAKKYRDGGLGKENVLTVEVFQALDFLPRAYFLGPLLSQAQPVRGAAISLDAEDLVVDCLPGDIVGGSLRVQPDVLLTSASHVILVEAKAPRGGAFQLEQLGRELLLAGAHADGRQAALLLVLGQPPPVAVKGLGRLSVDQAIEAGLARIAGRGDERDVALAAGAAVAWLTWEMVAQQVRRGLEQFRVEDLSTHRAVGRLATSLVEAVHAHSGPKNPVGEGACQ